MTLPRRGRPTTRKGALDKRAVVLVLALALGVSLIVAGFPAAIARASDTVTRWESFSESPGCGDPFTRPPFASRKGTLPDSERLLGPFGTYFGRTVGEARALQRYWLVPFSGGKRVKVHAAALPAFQQVSKNLAALALQGRIYPVTTAGSFYPRTVGGEYQISRHTLGTAIDINSGRNPYRADARLITDMPGWFVDAWTDAGFCWGGDWVGEKDPMHFSWIGPGSGFGNVMSPKPPKTSIRAFGTVDHTYPTAMAPVLERYRLMIGDATGNGGPDVAGLRSHPDGSVLDIASGYGSFGECSVRRWFIDNQSLLDADHTLMMDFDGDSRQDLVTLTANGANTIIRLAAMRDDFEDVGSLSRPISGITAVAGADYDLDHIADLWVAKTDGSLSVYAGPGFVTSLYDGALPSGAPLQISAADRDGGSRPELFAVYASGSGSRLEVLKLSSQWSVQQSLALPSPSADIVAIGAGDYDGDGRADFMALDESGRLTARVGNSPTGTSTTRWFTDPDIDCRNSIPLAFQGSFYDDDDSVHADGIEYMVAQGITFGCNPPFNDAYCPQARLTRAQAAAFAARALELPPSSTNHFRDDDGLTLEAAIDSVADARITLGCNPPANDAFCPGRAMTRAEFGTFLTRAFQLPPTAKDYFVDDGGHVLEDAVNRLAAAGLTKGCNPPRNDRFCPDRPLTRAEAATFLTRALR